MTESPKFENWAVKRNFINFVDALLLKPLGAPLPRFGKYWKGSVVIDNQISGYAKFEDARPGEPGIGFGSNVIVRSEVVPQKNI